MPRTRLVLVLALVAAVLAPTGGARAAHTPGGGPDGGPPLDPAPSASPAGHFYDWRGTPTDVPGTYTYSRGELIVTDHPFDDHGANTDTTNDRENNPTEYYTLLEGANAATGSYGDYAYPEGYTPNSADLVEVRIALDDHFTYFLFILNTLTDPSRNGIAAQFLREDDTIQAMLAVEGEHATFDADPVTLDPHPVDVSTDPDQNTIEVRVSRAVWTPPDESRVMVGSGLWDASHDTWAYRTSQPPAPPGPVPARSPYFDLAYVSGEGMDSYWRDRKQAGDLAGYNPEENAFPVDFSCLASHDDCVPLPQFKPRQKPIVCLPPAVCIDVAPVGGLFSRVFRSGQPLGEGISPQTRYGQDTSFPYKLYRSRYQPYAIYVAPPRGDGPQPLVLLMHFLAGNYMSYPITSWPEMKEWADALGAIVAMPLGRGEAGWYEGEAEEDVFEVWRDVASNYAVDRERVYLMGMSMGGYGTWRLGLLYPDLFAKALVWSGPVTPYSIWPAPAPVTYPYPNPPMCERDAPGCGFTLRNLFANGHNLPYLVIHGGADELVPSTGPEGWMPEFDRAGGSYRYVLYPTRKHETSYPGTTAHWVREWLGDLPPRVRNPQHVSYTLVADLFQPDFGIAYDGAYWVDGMRLADGAPEGSIDAAVGNVISQTRGLGAGVDLLGPWIERTRTLTHGHLGDRMLYLSLRGLARAEIDTPRINWDPRETQEVQGSTDTTVQVRLRGYSGTDVEVSGAAFTLDGNDLVLVLEPGPFHVTIQPR